ncbi:MAG: 1-deoxy-D-xylulose-5-phosphate reductoisomerase [Austwickia sp.]|nr:1-deoxy-D-xylulose-5-phosphate reductoisomerase [Austwickia sp.]MBK8437014.1 1-deoxy-D-xylulose-5-phosphate reductoisomerase [Austwickia sp.]MBK9100640.1 1-deoxy-D-xylulose-5-phosphate reductoisomerase [Austwickia sp.]
MTDAGEGPDVAGCSARRVAVLGSTGSIGTQALQIVRAHPRRFEVTALSARAADPASLHLLARQAVEFAVPCVAAADADVDALAAAIRVAADQAQGRSTYRPDLLTGAGAATQAAQRPTDVVLNGITGSIGLMPTLAALTADHRLALANKESLIVGGPVVKMLSSSGVDRIVPVDSEHSAIFQCLRGADRGDVRRLIITASGGPFRGWSADRLATVTPAQALAHPNFAMGTVITTNSATMVNKGLEVIEAHLLFDVPYDDITVVVHPQQQIHSMVEFRDGATLAQAGPPRMLVPIALGMSWPERLVDVDTPCDWTRASSWDFEPLDATAFPAVPLAYRVGRAGGTFPAVYNAANEEAVAAFHAGAIAFPQIVATVARLVDEWEAGGGLDLIGTTAVDRARDELGTAGQLLGNDSVAEGVAQVLAAQTWARARAQELLAAC